MAATKLIALHQNKGLSLEQTLIKRCDYVKNPNKTEAGEYISSYACNPDAIEEEFLISKRAYEDKTGRTQQGDIIAYQIRQSFKPGEITPEEANKIGYETAMRFTKGNHAFIVCTHTDRPHIHNHIIYNSTDLKCERKFRNFLFSGIALQRLSDIICLEHGLSVIKPRKPSEREKYNYVKKETLRDELRLAVDKALSEKPKDFDEFLFYLQKLDYEIKKGKHTAVRAKGRERFIRFRSLGEGYSENEIVEKIKLLNGGKRKIQKPKKEFDLLLDIQEIIAKGKGPGYERWAKRFNIKNLAKALVFLQENDIRTYEELVARTDEYSKAFNELSANIKAIEKRLDEISNLRGHIINFAKTKAIYDEYKKSGYSKSFKEEHREEITKHQAAKEAFRPYSGKKLPKTKELNVEFQELLAKKRELYSGYHDLKKKAQAYRTAKYDIDRVLAEQNERENARSSRRERYSTR